MTSRAAVDGDRRTLHARLTAMDGSGYGAYKRLRDTVWDLGLARLDIARVQADPYAPPSRVEVVVPAEEAGLPQDMLASEPRRRALADHLLRGFAEALGRETFRLDVGGQRVLDRSACRVDAGGVRVRLGVALPARGRRIKGRAAAEHLAETLPAAVADTLRWSSTDRVGARRAADVVEDAGALRDQLGARGLVAFVADGAVLPRASGVDDRPMAGSQVVAFAAPPELAVQLEAPHAGTVRGMGLPEGVDLIVGGGFHGKSTLLDALADGVWDHVPDDGREQVVTRPRTAAVRAEDGRRICRTDVSAFVGQLPTGDEPSDLSTDDASGSTSQAAAIVESVEAGADVLLIDEDTSATNLMVRDEAMAELVASDREPLIPFVDLVRALHRTHGVSTVLVAGGSGDFFAVADRVVHVDAFVPREVTAAAHAIAARRGGRTTERVVFPAIGERVPDPASVRPGGKAKIGARGTGELRYGRESVDLSALSQLGEQSEVVGIGAALRRLAADGHIDGEATIAQVLDRLDVLLARAGPDGLDDGRHVDFVAPRRLDVAGALNRLRALRIL